MQIEKMLEIPEFQKHSALKDEFAFAAVGLAHCHIKAMCRGLVEAGADLKFVYDANPLLTEDFVKDFPGVKICKSEEEILENKEIKLIASADIPALRAPLGIRAMRAGKDFFSDKAPFVSLEQLQSIKNACFETRRKYFVYYGERVHDESSIFADILIKRGVIGDISHIDGLAPHVLNPQSRPKWFFSKKLTGGILVDLASHQIEQLLYYSGSDNAEIDFARVENYFHNQFTDFEDFGCVSLVCENRVTGYFRIDWNSPAMPTWGDARTFICGSKGYLELRKNYDLSHSKSAGNIYVVIDNHEYYVNVAGKIGFPFFNALINDCINRTETAMSQEHALKVGELAVKAQMMANLETTDNKLGYKSNNTFDFKPIKAKAF